MRTPNTQSSVMSFVEAATNVVVGYVAAVLTQMVVFPLFGLSLNLGDNLLIGMTFTAVSLTRSYTLRRLFERGRAAKAEGATP